MSASWLITLQANLLANLRGELKQICVQMQTFARSEPLVND